jgi:sterol desaturase/sphingolipid hydroxylase (fatty acid hydroxylase superfamily)
MNTISALLFFMIGHFFGAYMFYFFHRYIFHGSLGKYPLLKQWRLIHTKHHRNPNDPGSFFFPWWANLLIWVLAAGLFFVSSAFAIGLASFFAYYAYMHRSAHVGADTRSGRHHRSHHYGKANANFSGAYPFIDKLFGTYEPIPVRVKKVNKRYD